MTRSEVTILYSSDTGHAEECAKAVARQCRNGGFASSAVRCGTMDSFDVAALLVRSFSECHEGPYKHFFTLERHKTVRAELILERAFSPKPKTDKKSSEAALASEPLVVFCVATAGKGEFCGNGRNMLLGRHP